MAYGAITRMPASRLISLPSALRLRADGASRRYFLAEIASPADAADSISNQVQRAGRQITSDCRPDINCERDMSLRSILRRCV